MRIVATHPSDSRIKLRGYRTRRSWVVRVHVRGGRAELVTLRAAPDDDVAALQEGRAAVALAEAGISPREHRQDQDADQRAALERRNRAGITFGKAVDAFLSSPDVAELRRRSLNDLKWALRSSHVVHLAGKRLTDIKLAAIEAVLQRLRDHPSTARKVGGSIRRLLRYALRHEWIERVPEVRLPRPRTRAEPLITVGEREDWRELVATLAAIDAFEEAHPGTIYPGLWRVQMLTGLRPEAVERLEGRDVNLTRRTLTIRAEVSKLKRELTVPVSRACADVLAAAARAKESAWTAQARESALVFPGRTGKPLSKNEPAAAFVDGHVKGKRHFRPARFRDTFITWCESRSVPYAQIARLVDWRPEGRLANYSEQGVSEDDRAVVEKWAREVEAARGKRSAKSGIKLRVIR